MSYIAQKLRDFGSQFKSNQHTDNAKFSDQDTYFISEAARGLLENTHFDPKLDDRITDESCTELKQALSSLIGRPDRVNFQQERWGQDPLSHERLRSLAIHHRKLPEEHFQTVMTDLRTLADMLHPRDANLWACLVQPRLREFARTFVCPEGFRGGESSSMPQSGHDDDSQIGSDVTDVTDLAERNVGGASYGCGTDVPITGQFAPFRLKTSRQINQAASGRGGRHSQVTSRADGSSRSNGSPGRSHKQFRSVLRSVSEDVDFDPGGGFGDSTHSSTRVVSDDVNDTSQDSDAGTWPSANSLESRVRSLMIRGDGPPAGHDVEMAQDLDLDEVANKSQR